MNLTHQKRHAFGIPSLMAILLASLTSLSIQGADSSARPNIVFIMADDMGYGDAGCFGQSLIQTPAIDRLARQGVRFTQCYAGSTVCAPSRSVLMTGLHTGHTRVRGNFGVGGVVGLGGGKGRIPLKDEDITVAEILQQSGYRTGIMGKWGLGEPGTEGTPNKKGFDTWFGYLNQRRAHSYYPEFLWLNEHRFELPGNRNQEDAQYTHDLITGFASHFIRANQDHPFFLYLPFTVPHSRFEVPSLGDYAQRDWPLQAKTYAAMITRVDRDIGILLDLLDELELAANTVVFFCSDNGAADRYDGLFNSSGPLRGRKRDLYEGGLRTPMIVRWPNKIEAGTISTTPWTFTDFLPTAAALAGVPAPSGIDGVSILPTLLGQRQDLRHRFLYWEFFERGFQQAARWQDWKGVIPTRGQAMELYDLATDLAEQHNVAAQHPAVVQRFKDYFAHARTESLAFPLPSASNN